MNATKVFVQIPLQQSKHVGLVSSQKNIYVTLCSFSIYHSSVSFKPAVFVAFLNQFTDLFQQNVIAVFAY